MDTHSAPRVIRVVRLLLEACGALSETEVAGLSDVLLGEMSHAARMRPFRTSFYGTIAVRSAGREFGCEIKNVHEGSSHYFHFAPYREVEGEKRAELVTPRLAL